MATRKRFSSLPKAARDRAARIGDREYGLSRRQVRERYNRGTYNPFARGDPEKRIPAEYRRFAEETDEGLKVDWGRAAYANIRLRLGPGHPLGERYGYNDQNVRYHAEVMASDAIAHIMALASEDELAEWASPQPDGEGNPPDRESWVGLPPEITMDDLGYERAGGWINIFWYH